MSGVVTMAQAHPSLTPQQSNNPISNVGNRGAVHSQSRNARGLGFDASLAHCLDS
jgi:hypothetical protein